MTRTRFLLAATLFGSIISVGSSASAQTAGEYAGQNSDGFSVELIVYKNSSGKPFLTVARESALFYCDGKLLLTIGRKQAYGTAILTEVPINNGTVTFAVRSNDLSALTGTVTFDGDTATGTLQGYAALFTGTKSPPNDSAAKSCRTRNLKFTAMLFNPLP